MLFEKAYEEFLLYVQKRHKKQGFITIHNDFKNNVLPYFKGTDIFQLSKNDVLNWQNIILDKNYSNKYNSKIYYTFNYFAKFCVLNSYIDSNFVYEIGPFKKHIELKEHVTYNIHQFRKFRIYLDNFVIKQYFNFIYFYGTRPGETMALRFLDLKKKKYICVVHNLQRKGIRELDTPKNNSSFRVLKINLLMRFRIWLLKYYYKKSIGYFSYDYYIFGGSKPLAPTTIDRYKEKACIKAKLPYITQHEFRHSYATRKIHKGVPIDIVSHDMGHSQSSTTLNIYVHNEKKYNNVLSL